jgi:hypothetical protein
MMSAITTTTISSVGLMLGMVSSAEGAAGRRPLSSV